LLAEAAAAQRWEVIPELAGLGFGINERTADGSTAAHLAAATGSLDTLRFLVEHGADLSATDLRYGADVLGWAKWFKQPDVVEYLEAR
jgi:ankyrin repeat protein